MRSSVSSRDTVGRLQPEATSRKSGRRLTHTFARRATAPRVYARRAYYAPRYYGGYRGYYRGNYGPRYLGPRAAYRRYY
ncbi:hypothetical protein [Microvirga tunisiensis]|uniref:hypothetical protein n=1 Tax=Microvirga tunisiensis TaxID=2108360 RepID=UPI00128DEC98|nr:hypothetical protein [Microvirga tunisiensis]MPR08613.1 hypothetical protein [Microvirga tunisiensis]